MAKQKLTIERLLTKDDVCEVLDAVEACASRVKSIVVITTDNTGVSLYHSAVEGCELLGMLEVGKRIYFSEDENE